MTTHITDKDFDKIYQEKGNIIVDFWADWCMPCKVIEPFLEEAQGELGLKVYKLNIDDYPSIAEQFNILSIPTLLCFKDGKLIGKIIGAMPKQKLYDKLRDIFQLKE
jgi:thioredoxin 1